MLTSIRHTVGDFIEMLLIKLRQPDFHFPIVVIYVESVKFKKKEGL